MRFCSVDSRRRSALPPPPELEDACRLLDDRAAILGTRRQDAVELALAHDHVLLSPDASVGEQLLDVEQPAGGAVHRVLALPGPKQRPGDRHLRQVHRQPPGGVVDGERHLGTAECRPFHRPGEDDVVHLRRADHSRALRPEHPGHGVDDVRLSRAVRTHDDGDAGLELEGRGVCEGLEAPQGERLEIHGEGYSTRRVSHRRGPAGRPGGGPAQCWQDSQQ